MLRVVARELAPSVSWLSNVRCGFFDGSAWRLWRLRRVTAFSETSGSSKSRRSFARNTADSRATTFNLDLGRADACFLGSDLWPSAASKNKGSRAANCEIDGVEGPWIPGLIKDP
jgi:hypothetical protein